MTLRASWEHFDHGADIGLRGVGATRESAFEQIALALTGVVTDPAGVRSELSVAIECEAPGGDLLIVDWLNAIIYEMAMRRVVFGRYQVHLAGTRLTAVAWGEPVDRIRHQPAVEVKGATYTALRFGRREDGAWIAECVVDV